MVKAPSSHGLDRKYRSWRKGKSAKAKKQGSLKHQLRGQERLLGKLLKKQESNDGNNDDGRRIQELQDRVQSLKDEIAGKESKEQERKNAKSSHGTRFLERQRATRLERTARKESDTTELTRIAMDMIYIAHFPHQKAYRPLYRNGKRWLQHSVSRAMIRQQIIKDLRDNRQERAKWISQDMYERVPSDWSVAQEVEVFGYPKGGKSKEKKATAQDGRFALNTKHDAFLEMANQLESKLAKEDNEQDKKNVESKNSAEGSSSDSDSSDGDEKEPMAESSAKQQQDGDSDDSSSSDHSDEVDPTKEGNNKRQRTEDSDQRSSSDSDSDSSDDEEDPLGSKDKPKQISKVAKLEPKKDRSNNDAGSSSSDSDSSSDSSSSDSDDDSEQDDKEMKPTRDNANERAPTGKPSRDRNNQDDSDSEDDFFVAAKETEDDDIAVFDRVKHKEEHVLAAENPARGDKSQGWATQRQRPGQFKKKRVRR